MRKSRKIRGGAITALALQGAANTASELAKQLTKISEMVGPDSSAAPPISDGSGAAPSVAAAAGSDDVSSFTTDSVGSVVSSSAPPPPAGGGEEGGETSPPPEPADSSSKSAPPAPPAPPAPAEPVSAFASDDVSSSEPDASDSASGSSVSATTGAAAASSALAPVSFDASNTGTPFVISGTDSSGGFKQHLSGKSINKILANMMASKTTDDATKQKLQTIITEITTLKPGQGGKEVAQILAKNNIHLTAERNAFTMSGGTKKRKMPNRRKTRKMKKTRKMRKMMRKMMRKTMKI